MAIAIPHRSFTCQDLDGATLQDCKFRVVDCKSTSTSAMFTKLGNIWNNNLCQTDRCYHQPVPSGSRFMLQTQFPDFFNPDPKNPAAGWGSYAFIELYSGDDVLVSSAIADFASRYGVGAVGGTSIQMVEIDTSLPVFSGLTDFYFRVRIENLATDTITDVVTQHFAFSHSCERIVKLTSRYPAFDCLNNYYGSFDAWVGSATEFQFDNSFWIRASLLDGEDQIEKDDFNGRVSKATLTEAFDLVLEDLVPYWEKNKISKIWAPAAEVYINNNGFELMQFSVDNRLTVQAGRMFLFSISLTKSCTLNYQCVTLDRPTAPIVVPPPVDVSCVEAGCIEVTCIGS